MFCKRLLVYVPVVFFLFVGIQYGYAAEEDLHAQSKSRCSHCHACEKPSKEDPCLLKCERPLEVSDIPTSLTGIPDIMYLDQLVGLYEPVIFPHKIHADMEMMGQGCAICHHNNPPGKILSCGACHGGPSNPNNLRQPGLKGAYHRQCLGCHREWSHDTACEICHVKRGAAQVIHSATDPTDITGKSHPKIEAPDKFVYQTADMSDGPVVTFHHKDHVERFGVQCINCHRKENCSRCHDSNGNGKSKHVREDPHQDCSQCHDVTDNCAFCHANEEQPSFDHGQRTGFALKPYHQKLVCGKCHVGDKKYAGLVADCAACHKEGFNPETFQHSVTGLTLDDTHSAASCEDCHVQGFMKPTSCESCHDAKFVYPQKIPGTLTH